jgi:carbamoyl-phosphate synthase large subunit
MNILFTSIGRRGYLIDYFRELNIEELVIFGMNSHPLSTAVNRLDYFAISPETLNDDYIPFVLNYCVKHNIEAIIPLIDIDTFVLSKHEEIFTEHGVKLILSNHEVIRTCHDKYLMHKFLKLNNFPVIKTYVSYDLLISDLINKNVDFPLILKPRWGFGSKGNYIVQDHNELTLFRNIITNEIHKDNLLNVEENALELVLFQEYIIGQEYNVDLINDLEGNFRAASIKVKLSVRSGETECAKIVSNNEIHQLCESVSLNLKHNANMDIDLILVDNVPFIIDMNPRFGGGYPFSHKSGVNLPKAIMMWLKNQDVPEEIFLASIGSKFCKDITLEIVK